MPALRVGKNAVIKNLQQHIENVRVRLFNFIKKNNAVRLSSDLLGQLAALLIADISRRRADKTRGAVLFHEFGHIEADNSVFITEHCSAERLAKLCFANAGRSEENERAERPFRVLQSAPAAPYCSCNGGNSLILTDDALVEYRLHFKQALAFLPRKLGYGDTCPARHNLCNFIRGDLAADSCRFLFPVCP